MRHAAAGNLFTLKMAMNRSHTYSHTTTAQPAAVGMSPQTTPHSVDENRESGRWPGPLLTVLDARECHSSRERGRATPSGYAGPICHTHAPWAEGVSANPQVHSRGNLTGITHGGIFAL
jgi:hypothetical protein